MSWKKQIIEIEPSRHIRKEVFVSVPMECPYCGGRCGFSVDTPAGPEIEECPDCKGSGEVVAMVTIDWKPNKE